MQARTEAAVNLTRPPVATPTRRSVEATVLRLPITVIESTLCALLLPSTPTASSVYLSAKSTARIQTKARTPKIPSSYPLRGCSVPNGIVSIAGSAVTKTPGTGQADAHAHESAPGPQEQEGWQQEQEQPVVRDSVVRDQERFVKLSTEHASRMVLEQVHESLAHDRLVLGREKLRLRRNALDVVVGNPVVEFVNAELVRVEKARPMRAECQNPGVVPLGG